MDIKEYISSGILELYVLGKVTEAQQREVENYADQYPEIREEISEIERSLEQYALLNRVAPSPTLLNNIKDLIRGKAQPAPSKRGVRKWLWPFLLLIALAVAALLWLQNHQLKSERARLEQIIADCRTENQQAVAARQRLQDQIAILRDTSIRVFYLKGTAKAPEAIAAVYWNPTRRKAWLDPIQMPDVPQGRQYQLWALVDGNPVDMEVFDLPIVPGEFTEVPFIENPDAFAVTLEQEGGVPSPTFSELYAISG